MNQIYNSPIKEGFRLTNENEARSKEYQIQNECNQAISQLKEEPLFVDFGGKLAGMAIGGAIIGLVLGLAMGFGGSLFFPGAFVGAGILVAMTISKNKSNKDKISRKAQLKQDAENRIRQLYIDADSKTVRQINEYDTAVKASCSRVLQKADGIQPMVDHTVNMFQRMVSHADQGSNLRFVECDLIYKVTMSDIEYFFNSQYSNPQDNFNFDKQRYRNLTSAPDCEGLAQAIAKLTVKKMMNSYPPNSLHLSVGHEDAKVTIHFKAANSNFVAAQDIL